jgi:MFS superfamily sulfate permease-like transporter
MCTPDLRLLRFSGVVFAEPPFKSARRLRPADALHDVIAGSTLAAMNIPQALGYTKIAGGT